MLEFGKTAVVERLLVGIMEWFVPTTPKDKELWCLILRSFLVREKFRCGFIERLKGVRKAIEKGEGK